MKALAVPALAAVLSFGTAHAAQFELIVLGTSVGTDINNYHAWLFNKTSPQLYNCVAEHRPLLKRFTARCHTIPNWSSKLPPSSTMKSSANRVQVGEPPKTAVLWQIDEQSGRIQVCYPNPSVVDGAHCIDITPP
jgi:hypothetical protein